MNTRCVLFFFYVVFFSLCILAVSSVLFFCFSQEKKKKSKRKHFFSSFESISSARVRSSEIHFFFFYLSSHEHTCFSFPSLPSGNVSASVVRATSACTKGKKKTAFVSLNRKRKGLEKSFPLFLDKAFAPFRFSREGKSSFSSGRRLFFFFLESIDLSRRRDLPVLSFCVGH